MILFVHGFFDGDTQVRNIRSTYSSIEDLRLGDYVKGPEPDRWHWMKNCRQYPQVVQLRRANRPTSDLCDDCLDLEKNELRKVTAV
jgi:hypothetical protein